MLGSVARKLFGSSNDRFLRQLHHMVDQINALEPELEALSDSDIQAKTQEFRSRLSEGTTLDDLLVEAFAVVREASKRTLGMRHFDVQLIGGIIQHRGMISEMKTGEGKTLVSTLSAYLNALTGKGVHLVTVNDYLAQGDAEWMSAIYDFLGITVGVITNAMKDDERKIAYNADITYGTNNEYGFDYLRDNMKYSLDEMVQRDFNFAIVDEVDSILIDEARTPLIISGPTEDNSELYIAVNEIIPKLTEDDYEKDEKARSITLTEDGTSHAEELLRAAGLIGEESDLYDFENVSVVHHVNQSLKAHHSFQRDVDYIVKDNKVIIIDEFTGRMMEGRRYSEGLHQALEAKEGAIIQNENQTLASITFQNYFRLYPKLAGMTGTALTEAAEFQDIYKLPVVEIPPHRPVNRVDHDDEIYRTATEKYNAIVDLIDSCFETGQPVLVGTVSIEKSETLAQVLTERKIKHNVLNARYHETEAQIISQAGRAGAVTIATNMAGRGTDIMLGGNPDMRIAEELADITDEAEHAREAKRIRAEVEAEKQKVMEAGGLYVVGTERHESRRIDNQLRGRSGRQGDPGMSKFFLSLEDDLMRIFGPERMDFVMRKMGLPEGEAIYHPWMNKALEKAQRKVEGRNYDIRKNLLKYDDVMNDQRKVVYEQRREILDTNNVSDAVESMREEAIEALVAACIPARAYAEQWDVEHLEKETFKLLELDLPVKDWAKEEGIADHEIQERLNVACDALMKEKEERFTPELMRMGEKRILLHSLDQLWKEHLHSLDHLRQGITLRAYGQRDPLNEYKQEAFTLFEHMLDQLRELVTTRLARLEIRVEEPLPMEPEAFNPNTMKMSRNDPAASAFGAGPVAGPGHSATSGFDGTDSVTARVVPMRTQVRPEDRSPTDPESWGKVGRNEACPCGSGKKFKHCHGALG